MGVNYMYCQLCKDCFHEDDFCDFLCIICNENSLNICNRHISQLNSFDKNDLNLFVCDFYGCKEKIKKFKLNEVLKECYEYFGPDDKYRLGYTSNYNEKHYEFQIKLINRYNEILNSNNNELRELIIKEINELDNNMLKYKKEEANIKILKDLLENKIKMINIYIKT